MDIGFPFRGYHVGVGTEKQPPGTTPYIQNMRVIDSLDGRLRGGSRGGLKRGYSEQISSVAMPVVELIQITIVS